MPVCLANTVVCEALNTPKENRSQALKSQCSLPSGAADRRRGPRPYGGRCYSRSELKTICPHLRWLCDSESEDESQAGFMEELRLELTYKQ